AATRTRSASPWRPATPARTAPGTTWTLSTAPSEAARSQPASDGTHPPGSRATDPQRELVEAHHQHALCEPDGEQEHDRREVEAAEDQERQVPTDPGQHRLGHRVEEVHDWVARIRVHPGEEHGDEDDPEVEPEQAVQGARHCLDGLAQDEL